MVDSSRYDVSGLTFDPALAAAVGDTEAALVLMHTRGRPQTMYAEAAYTDLTGEVVAELRGAVERANRGGVAPSRVIVDPGKVDDERAALISHEIAASIERELEYPGQVKITVIRESRATAYAS